MSDPLPPVETFTPEEQARLQPYVTNLDKPVFALVNMPEVVKGALFARYSRSLKSVRRLLLDEFIEDLPPPAAAAARAEGHGRAEALYERVFNEYGDDSVAQLGGVHLACEGVSNLLTKVLERGRLMAYLEQSTRYVPYSDQVGGKWKYHTPSELEGGDAEAYGRTLDDAFATYVRWLEPLKEHYRKRHPRTPDTPAGVYNRTIQAKALDALRGLLPAATRSNVGIYGTGQSYEMLLLRMRSSAVSETRAFADLILAELRRVIPSFLTRVDRPDRGGVWSAYFAETDGAVADATATAVKGMTCASQPEVALSGFDPDGELAVVAAALYAGSSLPESQLLERARAMTDGERAAVLAACVGRRLNRRHRPGRAFERTRYRFDILADYGAFRDLQRHRMLSMEWQALSPQHGFVVADAIEEVGGLDDWRRVMESSADLYARLVTRGYRLAAPYAVSMAYRIRFYMDMNAREAMHVIELRTAPQGHAAYRRVCQRMHRLIEEQAGHRAIAAAMQFVNHGEVELERLEAERAIEAKRGAQGGPLPG